MFKLFQQIKRDKNKKINYILLFLYADKVCKCVCLFALE